jgi:hypothetical protein
MKKIFERKLIIWVFSSTEATTTSNIKVIMAWLVKFMSIFCVSINPAKENRQSSEKKRIDGLIFVFIKSKSKTRMLERTKNFKI